MSAAPSQSSFLPVAGNAIAVEDVFCSGVCGFIGLLLCLNLVMHGLTYNKVQKLLRKKKDSRRD